MILFFQPTKVTQPEITYVSETIYKTTNLQQLKNCLERKQTLGFHSFWIFNKEVTNIPNKQENNRSYERVPQATIDDFKAKTKKHQVLKDKHRPTNLKSKLKKTQEGGFQKKKETPT